MRWLEQLLDYIFPRECFGCEKEGEYLCSACFCQIEYLGDDNCFLCGKSAERGICAECRVASQIDQIVVATKYTGTIAGRMIESFKFNFVEDLAEKIADILVSKIDQGHLEDIFREASLVPIPLFKKRLLERGFNQSVKIAKQLSPKYNSVVVPLLARVKETKQQARLSREERFQNVKDVFKVKELAVIPRRVILVDDVLTTGATFVSATKALKSAGVSEVICLAVCHG